MGCNAWQFQNLRNPVAKMQNSMVTLDSLSPNKRFYETYIDDIPNVLPNLEIVANTGWIHLSVSPNLR